MPPPVFDFRDEQGRPRKPTPEESAVIQRYLNDQNPIDTSVRYPVGSDREKDLAAERGEGSSLLSAPAGGTKFDEGALLGQLSEGFKGILASQQREEGIYARHAPELARRSADIEAEVARQQASPPTPPTVPEKIPVPTRQQYTDPTAEKGLFAVASLFAGLAMAGGRGRGMLAMAGLRGAMQGFNEGNLERYQAGMEQYKLQMDEQIKAYDEQYKSYMAILNSNRLTLEEKIRMYDLEATRQQDELGQEEAKQKRIDGMIKHATDIEKLKYESEKALAAAQDLPEKRAYELKMRDLNLRKAQAQLDRAGQIKANTQKQTLLKDAIRIEQKSLDQMQKEEKGLHSFWDWTGAANKPLKRQQKLIEDKKKKIDELQGKLENLAIEQAGLTAQHDTGDFEIQELP
jgi:hypothetical protein